MAQQDRRKQEDKGREGMEDRKREERMVLQGEKEEKGKGERKIESKNRD
jgi:hypothetical protein